ncbi:MAG: DJ-1/PfpI family protein [Lachnospiraceae bacterium]|nr:DJ-1/PfpI family protein [Lachnospiraceae bacterium]
MKEKAYLFLAEGFEEVEGLTVVDLLRRGQVELVTVSVSGSQLVTGSHKIAVMADCRFEEADLSDGTIYILPGGMPGTKNLGAHAGLTGLLKDAKKQGKKLAAICAAPSVYGQLGLLEGETATCYPGFEDQLRGAVVTENKVEVSGQMTTSRGVGTAIPFALKLLEELRGPEEAQRVGKSILWEG